MEKGWRIGWFGRVGLVLLLACGIALARQHHPRPVDDVDQLALTEHVLSHPRSKPPRGFKTEPMRILQPGDSWTYRVTGPDGVQTATLTVLSQTVTGPDGKPCHILRSESGAPGGPVQVSEGAFRQDPSGTEYLYGIQGPDDKTFHWGIKPRPLSIRVRSPLFPQQQWVSTIYLDDNRQQLYTATIEKQAPVTVPAGAFKALLGHQRTLFAHDHQVERIRLDDAWFVPSLGVPVKVSTTVHKKPVVQELVRYHLAGSPPVEGPLRLASRPTNTAG